MIKVLSTPGPVPLGRSQSRARRVLSQVKQTLDPAATEPVEGSENGDRVLLLARWDAATCSLVFHKTFPDRQLVETMTNAVSEDGATMTVTLTTTSKGGQSVTTVDTFSRARDSKRWSSG